MPTEPRQIDEQRPVPDAWRPTLRAIVAAFARGDFRLGKPIPNVARVSNAVAKQISDQVADYGATLVDLPDEAWVSSVASGCGRDRWEVLVDLWTKEEGRSDLVLHVEIQAVARRVPIRRALGVRPLADMTTSPTFRDFAGAIMQGDLDAAGGLLQTLLGTDAAQSRAAAEHFQRSMTSDPAFVQKAMGMRQVVTSGTREELQALLADCFQLDEPSCASATDAVWSRFRSS